MRHWAYKGLLADFHTRAHLGVIGVMTTAQKFVRGAFVVAAPAAREPTFSCLS